MTAKRTHCLIPSREREVRQYDWPPRQDDSRSCRRMISSRRWMGCFGCRFDGSQSQPSSGLAVKSPPRSSVPRTPQRFQTHQSIKLCHGRKTTGNHGNSSKILENPGKVKGGVNHTYLLIAKGFGIRPRAWFATRRLAVRSRSSPLNVFHKSKLRHLVTPIESSPLRAE